jgi:hypothetical protein
VKDLCSAAAAKAGAASQSIKKTAKNFTKTFFSVYSTWLMIEKVENNRQQPKRDKCVER